MEFDTGGDFLEMFVFIVFFEERGDWVRFGGSSALYLRRTTAWFYKGVAVVVCSFLGLTR